MKLELLANIDVDNLESAIAFYRDALGLRLGRRLGSDAAEMLGASSPIFLLLKPAGTAPSEHVPQTRRYDRHWTPVHLDFAVPDADVAVAQAKSAGAVLEGGIETHKWGRLARMADPFGNGFCLIQFFGKGYDEIA